VLCIDGAHYNLNLVYYMIVNRWATPVETNSFKLLNKELDITKKCIEKLLKVVANSILTTTGIYDTPFKVHNFYCACS